VKYHNNLSDQSTNSYFEVVSSFDVFILVGCYKTQHYIGKANIMGNQYMKITLQPGDYLYDLYGGVFVTYQDKFYPTRIKLSDKSFFEKSYGQEPDIYPVDKLKLISEPDIKFIYNTNPPVVTTPSSFYGRSVDSIIE
jgi:hypothetical protein